MADLEGENVDEDDGFYGESVVSVWGCAGVEEGCGELDVSCSDEGGSFPGYSGRRGDGL